MLAGELPHRCVALHQLREAEQDLDLQILVRTGETRVAGANDQRTVKGEVGLDNDPLRRMGTEAIVLGQRGSSGFGHQSALSEHPGGLHLERGSQLVDLGEVVRRQRPDEHTTVARLDEQPPPHQAVERGAQRVPPDIELLGECDLTEMLPGLEPAVEHLTLEFVLEGLDARGRLPADHRRERPGSAGLLSLVLAGLDLGAIAASTADAFTASEGITVGDRLAARTARAPGLHLVEGAQGEPEYRCHLNLLQGN